MTFLDHLDDLRKHIFRIAIVIVILFVIALGNKDFIFSQVIFAANKPDFVTFKWLCQIGESIPWLSGLCFPPIEMQLISTEMPSQFMKYMSVSFIAALIGSFPYIIFEIWRFVKPALKIKEKRNAGVLVFYVSFLFFVGVLFGYFFIAPVSISFFSSFKLDPSIANTFTIDSYISILTSLVLATGLIFQLPLLAYFLAKVGMVSSAFLINYRRHSILINALVAAIVTPSDVASMIMMAIPMVFLYEISIIVVKRVEKKTTKEVTVISNEE